MYIRKKVNRSGKVSVQIIDKSSGKYSVIKTIGCSAEITLVEKFVSEAESWIKNKKGSQEIDFDNSYQQLESLLDGIETIENIGLELLLGKLFDEIGFNKIKDNIFRYLVLSRLSYPTSKLKTTDYLLKYHNISIDINGVYRYLDKLYNKQKELVQQISYDHTLKILDNEISIVFYDVTTMYFEIESEDELRKTGFSKEGRHQNPQIVLGLLVSKHGYPLAYDIFEGKKYEGHTMIPIINSFKEKYNIQDLMVVADAGLLSNNNLADLEKGGYKYILGARLKNSSEKIKKAVLELRMRNGESVVIKGDNGTNIIVSYSDARARKDAYNRQKGVEKLNNQIGTGKLGKKNLNNRGYNKFLVISNEVEIELDQDKIQADEKWDGLKGYITNSQMSKQEVIENYHHLWQIEKAFRVSKTDLKIRPIYHRAQRRIEAHICITFTAYKIYKELERKLKIYKSELSPEKAIDIAKTIMAITIKHPITKIKFKKTLMLKEEQKMLANLFNF
jgi:transposase